MSKLEDLKEAGVRAAEKIKDATTDMVDRVTHGAGPKPAIPGITEEGEQLEIDGHLFTIKRMAGHRIQAVTVRMAQAEDAGAA